LEELKDVSQFELSVVEDVRVECKIVQEELEQTCAVLATMNDIVVERECTDPDRLGQTLKRARKLSMLASLRCPNWDDLLELGSQRLTEVLSYLSTLRSTVEGILDPTTLQSAVDSAEKACVSGKYIETLKRVLNELELAKNATGDLVNLWVQRRNIGCGRELQRTSSRSSPTHTRTQQQRPIDALTGRLASSARLRDFVGLSTCDSTLYVCNAMLASPGLKLEHHGLEASKEFSNSPQRHGGTTKYCR
jgi:hypothetical protein